MRSLRDLPQSRHRKSPPVILPRDMMLLAGFLVLGGLLWGSFNLLHTDTDGTSVRICCDGELLTTLPLTRDCVVTFCEDDGSGRPSVLDGVEAPTAGSNVIVIRDGICRVAQADCPDGICMRHAGIRRGGEAIICLPHRLVIEVTGEGAVDAVTW